MSRGIEKLEGSIANTAVGTGTPVRIRLEARFWPLDLRISPAAYLSPELPPMWEERFQVWTPDGEVFGEQPVVISGIRYLHTLQGKGHLAQGPSVVDERNPGRVPLAL